MHTSTSRRKVKTKWNLNLLYKSEKDPALERDLRKTERAYEAFEKKYRSRDSYLKNEKALRATLKDYDKLIAMSDGSRALLYFHFLKELDSKNERAEAMLNKLSERLTKAGNRTLFFSLRLGKIDPKVQKKFLRSRALSPYRYMLQKWFETSKYDLSEPEEKILSLKDLPSSSLWSAGVEKAVSQRVVSFGNKKLPVPEALNMVHQLPRKSRTKLWNTIMDKLYEVSEFAESELNALVIDKKINDELRGFRQPYSATVLSYEDTEESVMSLVKAVTERFDISQRFYKLKAKFLNVPHLSYADRGVSLGKNQKKITFPEAVETLREVLGNTHPIYRDILDRFLAQGQIDVFPKKGKAGGAYCLADINLPTFVLLNHVNDFNSLSTFAHEMGHAIHSERSKTQPPRYQAYTTSVAETASTFFENVLFNAVFDTLSHSEKIIALHDKIGTDIASIFRQIAFFNFELELHQRIRSEGSLSREKIAALLNDHMRSYMGPAVKLNDKDGYFFVTVSHFRRFFYVYSYAYGELISKTLYSKVAKDPSFIEKVDEFLRAGRSKKPVEIFGDIGIDTKKPSFFKEGLLTIDRDIDRLEKLVAKNKK